MSLPTQCHQCSPPWGHQRPSQLNVPNVPSTPMPPTSPMLGTPTSLPTHQLNTPSVTSAPMPPTSLQPQCHQRPFQLNVPNVPSPPMPPTSPHPGETQVPSPPPRAPPSPSAYRGSSWRSAARCRGASPASPSQKTPSPKFGCAQTAPGWLCSGDRWHRGDGGDISACPLLPPPPIETP